MSAIDSKEPFPYYTESSEEYFFSTNRVAEQRIKEQMMSDATKERSTVEWFVECGNSNSNESLARELAADGLGYESLTTIKNVPCHDDRARDFLRIPSTFIVKLKRAKKGSDVLKFRFWKRNGHDALTYPADFVEKGGVRQRPRFKSAAERLKAIKAAEAAKMP